MAFASMFIVFLVIVLAVLGFMFIVGLILLITGIVRKKNPKNIGKRSPTISIVLGAVLLVLPVGTGAIAGGCAAREAILRNKDYDIVTDKWRNVLVTDKEAAQSVTEQLLDCAEKGDKETIKKLFSASVSGKDGFDKALDEFIENYPKGLSDGERKDLNVSGSSHYDKDGAKKYSKARFRISSGGEEYFISLDFCYYNKKNKDEIGLESFTVENLEAKALKKDREGDVILIDRESSDKVTARLIGGNAYIFTPAEGRLISESEMSGLLKKHLYLSDISSEIGQPNAQFKMENATGYDYFYELEPKDGEPRFIHITTDTPMGKVLGNYLCSDEESFFSQKL